MDIKVRFFEDGSWMNNPWENILDVKAGEVHTVCAQLASVAVASGKAEIFFDESKKNEPKKIEKISDITELGLTDSLLAKLKDNDVDTLEKLLDSTESDLQAIKGLGQAKIDDIKDALEKHEFSLKAEKTEGEK